MQERLCTCTSCNCSPWCLISSLTPDSSGGQVMSDPPSTKRPLSRTHMLLLLPDSTNVDNCALTGQKLEALWKQEDHCWASTTNLQPLLSEWYQKMLTLEPKWESLWIWRWVMSECGMRYSNLRCFPFLDLNRLRTWPQVHILRQAVNDQIWVGKKPDSSPVGQLLDLILSIRAPGARIYNLSYSLHPSFLRLVSALSFLFSWASILSIGCIVEGRRLPLVVAVHSVQWRIVSRANQPPGAQVTIFSFSRSHYLAFPMHNGLIAQFDDSVSKIHPYLIRSHSLWLRIRPSKNILYWIFFRGEYFSGWILFWGEYFSGVNIFQECIFFRGEYFEYGVIMNDSVSDTESYFRYGVII